MSRAELASFVALALGLAGCMKIYPDPELPDVMVEWFDGDCSDNTGDVSIVMTGVDDATEHHEITVPCTVINTTFKDVSRQRFHIAGTLLDTSGGVYGASETDVDLRNGFDETAALYFGGFDNFRIGWVFDSGATCASLGADGVMILLSQNGLPYASASQSCELGALSGSTPAGTYSLMGYAVRESDQSVHAASQPLEPVVITPGMRADLGTITLTPCGSMCPDPFGP